eukprot:4134672-Ditylum_brightwellii.AAC.1
MAKYIRAILKELKIGQHRPTMIYEDNAAAIMMANAKEAEKGNIKRAHICGVANPSNALTKALDWTLDQCHVTRMMRHTGYNHTCTS